MHLQRERGESPAIVAKHELLYEDLVKFRDSHPIVFDEHHWFFFGILTDPAYMERIVQRWERDEPRFDYWHPYLWRVLDGYIHERQFLIPPPPPPSGNEGLPGGNPSPPENHNRPSTENGGGHHSGGGGAPPQAVPEPSAFFLLLSGMVLVGVGAALGRRGKIALSETLSA